MIENRNQGTPIQYVLGRWQFRNLELAVSPQALIPRPETEQLVDWALVAAQQSPPLRLALDLGTGSGAIALSLATEVDNLEVWATELSPAAATLARANLAGIGGRAATRVRILDGSWFEPLSEHLRDSFDLIVANPPYLAHAEMAELDASVRDFEPHESLFSGPTGTEDLRLIVDEARSWLRKGGTLALEMSPWQTDELAKYMQSSGYQQVVVHTDLAGLQRSVTAHS
jgi:release factor glutamine methyltransferase